MGQSTTKWRRRVIAAMAVAGLLAAWIAAAPLLADALVVERPMEKSDAIVVLSGAADYVQRARGGALAFGNGIAPRVILTDDAQRGGWDDAEKGNPYFVERTTAELVKHGVPPEAIEKLPGNVKGTAEEADLIVRTAVERGYTSLLIVTSDFHSRRALWTFEQTASARGDTITIGLLRAPSGELYPNRHNWWLSLRGWRTVAAEYVKFGYYWLFYRM